MNIGTPNLAVEQGDTCDARLPNSHKACGKQAIASYQNKQWYLCLECALQLQGDSK